MTIITIIYVFRSLFYHWRFNLYLYTILFYAIGAHFRACVNVINLIQQEILLILSFNIH